jgi:hypothetical protein
MRMSSAKVGIVKVVYTFNDDMVHSPNPDGSRSIVLVPYMEGIVHSGQTVIVKDDKREWAGRVRSIVAIVDEIPLEEVLE